MAISFINATSATADVMSGGTLACNVPANTREDDVMLAWQTGSSGTAKSVVGGGWVEVTSLIVSTHIRFYLWRRTATSGEPASYTFSDGQTAQVVINVVMATYRGVNHDNPIQTFTSASNTTGSTLASGSIATAGETWIVHGSGRRDDSATIVTSTTSDGSDQERADVGSPSGSTMRSTAVYDSNRAVAAGSHSRTVTLSTATPTSHAVIIAALNPLIIPRVVGAPFGAAVSRAHYW